MNFIPIPTVSSHFLMFPTVEIKAPPYTKQEAGRLAPPEEDNAFALVDEPCSECGRQGTRFWSEYYRVQENTVIGAVEKVMSRGPAALDWFCSDELARLLRKARLTGFTLRPNRFAN